MNNLKSLLLPAALAATTACGAPHRFNDSAPYWLIRRTVSDNYQGQPCDFLMNAFRERVAQASLTSVVHKACHSTFTNPDYPAEFVSLTLLPDEAAHCPAHNFGVYPNISKIFIKACDERECPVSTLQCEGWKTTVPTSSSKSRTSSYYGY